MMLWQVNRAQTIVFLNGIEPQADFGRWDAHFVHNFLPLHPGWEDGWDIFSFPQIASLSASFVQYTVLSSYLRLIT